MNPPVAVLDACVLYSASLRDLFMWLATAGLYLPKWTEQTRRAKVMEELVAEAERFGLY